MVAGLGAVGARAALCRVGANPRWEVLPGTPVPASLLSAEWIWHAEFSVSPLRSHTMLMSRAGPGSGRAGALRAGGLIERECVLWFFYEGDED